MPLDKTAYLIRLFVYVNITGEKSMAYTVTQFLKQLPARRKKLPGVQLCAVCKIPLQETLTGNRKTGKGHVCSNCYFDAFSSQFDLHPIAMPRSIRGT